LLEGSQENGVAFVLDLTERKQAEAERQARQAAEASNRAKSAFLANMSHELRTPLNAILGYAQILQRDHEMSGKRASGLNTIYQSGEHLLALIDDVLDLSKIEAGKLELYPSALNLLPFLQVIGDIIRVKAEQKGLMFHLDARGPLPAAVRADERRLRQVLLNLLGNAVKFTDHGEVCLRLEELARSETAVSLRFEVADTGIGIRPDELETIFKPFEQVGDVQRRSGGTGLGLTLSRQLIHLMDSALTVESQVGRGSRFTFDLTLALEAEPATPPVPRVVTGYRGPRRRLLVVDDVPPNRAMLVDLLSPLGFLIDVAADGQAALEQAQERAPDLILMDMVMPVMDGPEAMRHLRRLEAFKHTPIIAVSASASGQDQAHSVAAGANVFLSKPIDPDQLLQYIGTLLGLAWEYEQAEAVSAEPLVAPPRAELERLHDLALAGNMRDILHWAEQLALSGQPYLPFADKLRRLAEGYQSKAILSLAEQHMTLPTE
jgi:CheY-like chemotaxis protein